MTSRERILTTLKGSKPDRPAIWLRDEFNLNQRFNPFLSPDKYRTIGSGLEYDEFTDSWITRDKNRDAILDRHREAGGDIIRECKIPGNVCNRFLVIPPENIRQKSLSFNGDFRIEDYVIPTPKGDLSFTVKFQKDVSTQWVTEEPVKNFEDLEKIMSIPFSLTEMDFAPFHEENRILGDRGAMMVQVDTPLVTVSGMMKFEDYLMLTATDRGLLKELCDMAYERISLILDVCLEAGMGPVYRFNGSEQSTPPMNSPDIYENFIYRYEKQLIKKVHDHGCLAAVHCHGYVKDILPLLIDMGVDMLDPIEAPPSGNVTFEEACRIAGDKITLAGNIQLRDLQELTPSEISDQVKSLIHVSRDSRFILNTSASPLTYIDDKTRENYLAMIETWKNHE